MNLLSKSILLIIILFSLKLNSQTYNSRKATLNEKIQIIYSKGYFNFLYTAKDKTRLILNDDKTFTLNENFCKVGSLTNSGNWKLVNKELILEMDSLKTIKFKKFNDNVFYKIETITRLKGNKKIKSLTLLSNQ